MNSQYTKQERMCDIMRSRELTIEELPESFRGYFEQMTHAIMGYRMIRVSFKCPSCGKKILNTVQYVRRLIKNGSLTPENIYCRSCRVKLNNKPKRPELIKPLEENEVPEELAHCISFDDQFMEKHKGDVYFDRKVNVMCPECFSIRPLKVTTIRYACKHNTFTAMCIHCSGAKNISNRNNNLVR